MKTCPHCAEQVQDAAVVCKHCGRDIGTARAEGAQQTPTGSKEPSTASDRRNRVLGTSWDRCCGRNHRDRSAPFQQHDSLWGTRLFHAIRARAHCNYRINRRQSS